MKVGLVRPCIISLGDLLLRLAPHQGHTNLEIFTTAEADQGPQYTRIFNLNRDELVHLRDGLDAYIRQFDADRAQTTGHVEIEKVPREKT